MLFIFVYFILFLTKLHKYVTIYYYDFSNHYIGYYNYAESIYLALYICYLLYYYYIFHPNYIINLFYSFYFKLLSLYLFIFILLLSLFILLFVSEF